MLCECGDFDHDHDDDDLWFDPPSGHTNKHDLTALDTANANVRCLRCAKTFIKQSEWMETPCDPQEITTV